MNRWGDSSDDEDVGAIAPVIHHTNTLKKTIPKPNNVQVPQNDLASGIDDALDATIGGDHNYEDFDRYGDGAAEANNYEADTDSEEDGAERQLRIVAAKLKAERKRAESQKKKASVTEQLADLDEILNEFGIDSNVKENEEDDDEANNVCAEGRDCIDNAAGTSGSSKRKKSKKKKKVASTNQLELEQINGESVSSAPANPDEAAKVLKMKSASAKKKTKVNEAAAVAAKELKAAAVGATKKKKKKDKEPQFGR